MREIPPNVKKPADAAAMRAYLVVAIAALLLAVAVFLIVSAVGHHAADTAAAARTPRVALFPALGRS